MRFKIEWDSVSGLDIEYPVSLGDGEVWSETVLNDLENANWHTARAAFLPLIELLPEIYLNLPTDLRVRLQWAVDAWDNEF